MLLSLTLWGCSHRVPTTSERDASAPVIDASAAPSREVVGVLKRPLGCAPMLFHPTLPLVAELEGARCHVWDLEGKAYRGSVDGAACKAWSRPEPASVAPPAIASATPHSPMRAKDALLFGQSRDGLRALSGRRDLARVTLWGPPALTAARELTIEDARSELEIVALTFTAKNKPIALTLGNGPVLWLGDKLEARQPANEHHVNVSDVSADPLGRYAGYAGTMDRGRSWFPFCAVIRTSDGESVIENSGAPPPVPRVVWAQERNAALVLDVRPLPVEPGDDVSVTARLESLASGSVATDGFERGILHHAAIAPQGTAVLLAFDSYAEPPPDGPDTRSAKHLWSVFGRSFHAEMNGTFKAAAWAGEDRALFVALDDGTVSVFFLAPAATPPLAKRATWKGRAPVALSPDGRSAGFMQGGDLVLGSVMNKAITRTKIAAPSVIAWGARAIAVATSEEILLLDPGSRAVLHRLSQSAATGLLWEPAGARLVAIMPGKLRVIEVGGSAGAEIQIGLDAQVAWVGAESLVIREKTEIRHMVRRDGAWIEGPRTQGVVGGLVSHDGRFLAEGETIRRIADDEVLHLDTDGNFTDSVAYDRILPREARFREGDVIDGRFLPLEEMTLESTVDLVARFASGAAIPHQKRSH